MIRVPYRANTSHLGRGDLNPRCLRTFALVSRPLRPPAPSLEPGGGTQAWPPRRAGRSMDRTELPWRHRKSTRVSLRAHPEFNEKWLQEQIVGDVPPLGLGDLNV
jgi:hypothetical protein